MLTAIYLIFLSKNNFLYFKSCYFKIVIVFYETLFFAICCVFIVFSKHYLWPNTKFNQVVGLISIKRLDTYCIKPIHSIWWLRAESNHRHIDFQSIALPTELLSPKWRSRRDLYSRSPAWQAGMLTPTPRNLMVAEVGFEPTTSGLWARRATSCSTPRYKY